MSEVLKMFKSFITDKDASTMFITGVAGTGKTTSLSELLQYCIDENIKAVASAYTHRACAVLRTKLPKKAVVCTLHSFLVKRPTINDKATTIAKLEGNQQHGAPEEIAVLFVDEFSMVGEKDYVCINELLSDEDGNTKMKIVYIGDPNQLPPVKDAKAITPKGRYWFKLTEIHRQKNANPLIDTLLSLNDFINGEEPQPLLEHETFTRGVDIAGLYATCKTNKVLLAYTNARVEELNAEIEGKVEPIVGDTLYSPTTRKTYILTAIDTTAAYIQNSFGDMLALSSKYKTLETIHKIPQIKFYSLVDEEGQESVHAAVFGHSSFLIAQQDLANKAVAINKQILATTKEDPKEWARANWGHQLSRDRARHWSHYLAFKDFAICLDFAHAMTVHKSQGSTFETVFIDTEDLGICAKKDYELYLKLLYVAISRASKEVFTN